jgi:membrane protein
VSAQRTGPPEPSQPTDTGPVERHGSGTGHRRLRRLTGALWRTPVALWRSGAKDRAAALTYYAILALFPALLVTVCSIGLAGPDANGQLADQLTALVPEQSRLVAGNVLQEMADQRSTAWVLASSGTVAAVWSASSYLGVFRRAMRTMYGGVDHRPSWRTAPRIALSAFSLLALLVTSAFTVVLTREAATALGRALGIGGAISVLWSWLRWPLLLTLAAVTVLIVFRTGPPETRALRRAVPGGIVAVALWLLTSAGFALYTSHSGTYNRLYGSLAGIIVFLVWLWVTNLSLLVGAQFNAELLRGKSGAEGAGRPGTYVVGPARRAGRGSADAEIRSLSS